MKIRSARISASVAFTAFGVAVANMSAAESVPWEAPTYGTAHHQDGLANTQVGTAQRKVAYRFRAKHTGHVTSALFYLIGGIGYSGGNGGRLLVELRSDDPSNPGFPSQQVLGSTIVENTLAATRPMVTFGSGAIAQSSDLLGLPYLKAGSMYHLVFTNIHATPQTNFVSVNSSWMQVPQAPDIQPGVATADLAVMMTQYGGPWVIRDGFTPIFEIRYWNSATQGRDYQYGAEVHNLFTIDNVTNYLVRERFTVTGGDKPTTGVYARLKKVGNPSSLSIQLRKTSDWNTVIASVDLTASSIPTGQYSWVGGNIDYILEEGEEYFVMVKENSGGGVGHYLTFPVADGAYYGFTAGFPDGVGEVYTGGSDWVLWSDEYTHLQFYFELAE